MRKMRESAKEKFQNSLKKNYYTASNKFSFHYNENCCAARINNYFQLSRNVKNVMKKSRRRQMMIQVKWISTIQNWRSRVENFRFSSDFLHFFKARSRKAPEKCQTLKYELWSDGGGKINDKWDPWVFFSIQRWLYFAGWNISPLVYSLPTYNS